MHDDNDTNIYILAIWPYTTTIGLARLRWLKSVSI